MSTTGDQYLMLRAFLGADFLTTPDAVEANSEASKLRMGRLNQQQFAVFTIDLIDEILRRKEGPNASAHLAAREDFHPKRNQTRQKLASLALVNFKKMACDVFFELERRFPNLVHEYPNPQQEINPPPLSVTTPPPQQQHSRPYNNASETASPVSATSTPKLTMHSRNPSSTGRSIDEVMADLGDLVSPSRMAALNGSANSAVGGDASVLKDAMERMRKDTQQRTEALSLQIEHLERDLKTTTAALEAARKEANEIGEEFMLSATETDELRKELSQYKSEGGDVRKEVTSVRKELSESRAESSSLRAEMSQLRQTLQAQVSEITKNKKDLAEANRRHQEAANESANLRVEIAQLRQDVVKHKTEHQKQIAAYISLQADYTDIKSHLEDQQTLFGEVRIETTSLLSEVKNLALKNTELRDVNEGLLKQNEETLLATDELKDQVEELGRLIEQIMGEKESLQNQIILLQNSEKISIAAVGPPPLETAPSPTKKIQSQTILIDGGILDKSAARAYQDASEEVLEAIRSASKSSLLPALKSLISACKQVTESFEEFETLRSVSNGRQFRNQAKLEEARTRFSSSLAKVISAAKVYLADAGNVDGAERVQQAVSQLTLAVNDVAALLKTKAGMHLRSTQKNHDSDAEEEEEEEGVVSFYAEVQELKEFVEAQTSTIVEGIHGLLSTMRSGGSAPGVFVQELDGKAFDVVGIVKGMCKAGYDVVSRMAPENAFRLEAQDILNQLHITQRRLEVYVGELGKMPQSKEVRQGIAATAYDLAKLVKNLVALLDGYEE